MAQENEMIQCVCSLCGVNMTETFRPSNCSIPQSGAKPMWGESRLKLTCCDSCYPTSPFVLFLRGLVFGHAVSNLLKNDSMTHILRQHNTYDGASDSDETVMHGEETYDKAFYLPDFAGQSGSLCQEAVVDEKVRSEFETDPMMMIKAESQPDVCTSMHEDNLDNNSQNCFSTQLQTPEPDTSTIDVSSVPVLKSPVSISHSEQCGRGIQHATRRKKTQKFSDSDGKKSKFKCKGRKQKLKPKKNNKTVSLLSAKDTGKKALRAAVQSKKEQLVHNRDKEDSKLALTSMKTERTQRKQRLVAQCSVCYKLLAKFMLGRHMETKHPGEVSATDEFFYCKDCGEKYEKLTDLQAHSVSEHQVQKNFKCKICSMSFAKIRNLSLHTRLRHKMAYMKECDICGEAFQKWEELPKHRFKAHGVSDHPCHICGKSFVHEQALNAHLDAHAGVKKYFCEVCGKGFVRFTNLCTHKLTHTAKAGSKSGQSGSDGDCPEAGVSKRREEQRNCTMCVQSVVNKSTVCPVHSAQSMTRSYVCSVCGKGFMSSSHLSAHSKQHLEPRFSCDLCAKRFTYKCNLKTHHLSHLPLASKRIFHCQHCSKTFNSKHNLSLHERTHEEPMYYSCYVCGKGFTRSSNLYRHIRNMHPEHAKA